MTTSDSVSLAPRIPTVFWLCPCSVGGSIDGAAGMGRRSCGVADDDDDASKRAPSSLAS